MTYSAATPATPIPDDFLDRLARLPHVNAASTNPHNDGPRYVVVVRQAVCSFWTDDTMERFIEREEERDGLHVD